MRIILHMDMNSYFASVEQQANPHLRGRPVGVCEHLGGIIIAPSAEARLMGIKPGATVWEAIKIFPQIVLLPTDPDKYRHVTKKFLNILNDYSDDVEQYSIDEAFIDITRYTDGDYRDARLLGMEIKQRLRLEIGEWVSASVGVGPNKLISKIAADLGTDHIDRLGIVRPQDISKLYDELALTDVPGIGRRIEKALHRLGIFTLKQLAVYPLGNLLNQFGIWGYVLRELANFRDTSAVVTEEEPPKSFGHAYTVPKPLTSEREIRKLMFKLSDKVGRRMRKHGASGSIVHYFHSDRQYTSFGKQRKIRDFINEGRDIFRVAWKIFLSSSPFPAEGGGMEGVSSLEISAPTYSPPYHGGELKLKIMGVSVSGLRWETGQDFLFEQYERPRRLAAIMDKINNKYGDYTITRARFYDAPDTWAKDTVGFGRTRSLNQ